MGIHLFANKCIGKVPYLFIPQITSQLKISTYIRTGYCVLDESEVVFLFLECSICTRDWLLSIKSENNPGI